MSLPDEILTLVRASTPAVTVFDSGVPDEDESEPTPDRYAIYWPDIGTSERGQVSNQSTGRIYRFQVNSVAPDRQMAAWIAEHIRDGIADVRPIIPGFVCGQILHTFSLPAQRDEQVLSKRVVVVMDRYELLAEQS